MKRLNLLLIPICFLLSCSENKPKEKKKENNTFYDRAFEFRERGIIDSAIFYFDKAKSLFLQQKDSLGAGKCLVNMAIFSTDKGDYYGGQEFSLDALSYFNKRKKNQYVYISSNFNNLGIASHKLGDYENALKFYDSAIEFSTNVADNYLYLNNKANAYQELKEYDEALKIYSRILKRAYKNQKEYARVLTNISLTTWLQNPNYNAIPGFLKALHIREKENDLFGQNSSYAHLSDYYVTKRLDSALIFAKKMYWITKKINNPDDELRALRKLINLSPPRETKLFFERYQNLIDSIHMTRSAAKNQFALIRYQIEKHKADNLILQKDNTEKKYQIILLISGIFLLLIASIFWYKKRKQRLEMEAQNAIRESQLKTSKKVHDVVANGLYRVMTEIENRSDIDKGGILDRLENMYEKSRDISYEVEELQLIDESFDEKITGLLKSFNTENIKVIIKRNDPELWEKVSQQAKHEIEHILQELMINMKKHSHATKVMVWFEQQHNQINIYYTDNGIGIAGQLHYGNGLTNTGNRIASIHGAIIFDTKAEEGLKIQLSFPVS